MEHRFESMSQKMTLKILLNAINTETYDLAFKLLGLFEISLEMV